LTGGFRRPGVEGPAERALATELGRRLDALRAAHEAIEIRRAAAETRGVWSLANAYLAAEAPWTTLKSDRARAGSVLRIGLALVRTAAIAAWPFIPATAERVLNALGEPCGVPTLPTDGAAALDAIEGGRAVSVPPLLFRKLDTDGIARLRARSAG